MDNSGIERAQIIPLSPPIHTFFILMTFLNLAQRAFATCFLTCLKYHIMDVLCAYVGLYNQQMSARPRAEGFLCCFPI